MASSIGWEEYVVFFAVLAASTATGIFYWCFGSKNKTTKEYLLASREMSIWPVSLSLLCSMVSSIALMGYPVEFYSYGTQYILVVICYIPLGLSLSYLYLPVYFSLNLSSVYEYAEIRFSKQLRTMVSAFSLIHVITLTSTAVYAPSLAIELVTGVQYRISTAVICFVCIFYSTVGGLKAVLWADVLQGLVMLASLATIAGKGAIDIGGMGVIWDYLKTYDRVEFFNVDPDPRTRHTLWTSLLGGYFVWLPTYAATQIQVQRFLSLPTIGKARQAVTLNFIGLTLVVFLCAITGMVMVAKFHDCNPLDPRGMLKLKPDQLVPHFASEVVENVPGLLGLFISGLTSASMSTMSSGLTAVSSVVTYDYVKRLFPKIEDKNLSWVSMITTFVLGVICYLFIFVVERMGSVLPAITSLSSLLIGPTLGLFTLGIFFPPATSWGGFFGMLTTFCIMIPFTVLQNVYRSDLPNQTIPLNGISGCPLNGTEMTTIDPTHLLRYNWKEHTNSSSGIDILALSYMWHSAVTCLITCICGMIFSLIHRALTKETHLVDSACISPPLLKLWKKMFPEYMKKILANQTDSDVIIVSMDSKPIKE